jgi:hypothetical protein
MRKFYHVYAPSIQQTPSVISEKDEKNVLNTTVPKGQTVSALFRVSWFHYQILMRIEHEAL